MTLIKKVTWNWTIHCTSQHVRNVIENAALKHRFFNLDCSILIGKTSVSADGTKHKKSKRCVFICLTTSVKCLFKLFLDTNERKDSFNTLKNKRCIGDKV